MVDISPEPTYSHAQEFGYKPLKQANNLHYQWVDQNNAIGKTYSRDCKNYISVHFIFLQPQNAMQR